MIFVGIVLRFKWWIMVINVYENELKTIKEAMITGISDIRTSTRSSIHSSTKLKTTLYLITKSFQTETKTVELIYSKTKAIVEKTFPSNWESLLPVSTSYVPSVELFCCKNNDASIFW